MSKSASKPPALKVSRNHQRRSGDSQRQRCGQACRRWHLLFRPAHTKSAPHSCKHSTRLWYRFGRRSGATDTNFTAATDGLTFSLAAGANVHVFGLTIIRAAAGATYANTGLTITTPAAQTGVRAGQVSILDISFIGASTFWATGIYVFNTSNASFDHISYIAPSATGTGAGVGISIAGQNASSYLVEAKFHEIDTQGGSVGLQIGDWIQGVYVTQSSFIGNDYGIRWSGVAGDADLWLAVSNTHFNSGTRGLLADTAMSPQIVNTYTLHFGIPSRDTQWAALQFINLSPGLIANNTIYGNGTGSTSTQEYGIVLTGGNDCTIVGNFINNTKNAGIYVNTTINTLIASNIGTLPAGIPLIQYAADAANRQAYGNQTNGVADLSVNAGVLTLAGACNATAYRVNNARVVGATITGWGISTGGVRAAVTASSTLPQVAAALAQLLTDLETHGLIA